MIIMLIAYSENFFFLNVWLKNFGKIDEKMSREYSVDILVIKSSTLETLKEDSPKFKQIHNFFLC